MDSMHIGMQVGTHVKIKTPKNNLDNSKMRNIEDQTDKVHTCSIPAHMKCSK